MHVLVLGLVIWVSLRHRPAEEALEPTGVSVVYDSGSTSQQAPRQAQIPAPAQAPATPPPAPPPPKVAQTEPEVNLDMPDDLMTPPAPAPPTPQPQSQPAAQPRTAHRAVPRHSPRNYTVMNNMSFGNASPLSPTGRKGLNLSLPQSDAQAALAPNVTIQGDVGADWNAGFNKWVYAHLYYPNAAAEQGQQGTVTVEFTAHRDGHVTGLRMTDSSGSTFLDQAWTGIFAQNMLPPFPPGGADTVKITATVQYELEP